MIKRLELWNFESHEHTIIDDLHAGFNLICGDSDAGKSSIIRAINLVSYNQWNIASLRIGSKIAKVEITTEKGKVKVEKGKGVNLWRVENFETGKIEEYENIGKKILEDASDIIGLRMVQLGDSSIRVNVMDQLEGHFMLAEMDGEKASGSLRAQVIDEISGLSGIETLIKKVSLDNLRNGKDVKLKEESISKLKESLNDEGELEKETLILTAVSNNIDTYETNTSTVSLINTATSKLSDIVTNDDELKRKLRLLPLPSVLEVAKDKISECGKLSESLPRMKKQSFSYVDITEGVGLNQERLSALPDCTGLSETILGSTEAIQSSIKLSILNSRYDSVKSGIVESVDALKNIPACKGVPQDIETIEDISVKVIKMSDSKSRYEDTKKKLSVVKIRSKRIKDVSGMDEIIISVSDINHKLVSMRLLQLNYQKSETAIEEVSNTYDELSKDVVVAREDEQELKEEIGECPTCGKAF